MVLTKNLPADILWIHKEDDMTTQIKTWGNSQAIRIPKDLLVEAGIHENDDLDVTVKGESIVITKVHRRLSLEERIKMYGPIQKFPDIEWGEPVGRENW